MGVPGSADEADIVVLFGGDGTIHRHLGPLVKLGLPVLVVPAGSGNDFARALGLRRVRDSLAAWGKFCNGADNVRSIDLGIVRSPRETRTTRPTHTYFCCVAGVGLDGEVARRANRWPRWLRGHGGYVLSLAPTVFAFKPFPAKISIPAGSGAENRDLDWTARSDQPTILAAFANAPLFGGGMKIAPQAKMDDGLLDVCVVGGVDPFKLFLMFPAFMQGGISGSKKWSTFRLRASGLRPISLWISMRMGNMYAKRQLRSACIGTR